MAKRPIRILLGKVGLDGHDRGIQVIAQGLRDAGMEVIFTGIRQTIDSVVRAALEEDVDAIGLSSLSGAHDTLFPRVRHAMDEEGLDHVLLIGGGIIPDEDVDHLKSKGVSAVFTPGTDIQTIVDYLEQHVQNHET